MNIDINTAEARLLLSKCRHGMSNLVSYDKQRMDSGREPAFKERIEFYMALIAKLETVK